MKSAKIDLKIAFASLCLISFLFTSNEIMSQKGSGTSHNNINKTSEQTDARMAWWREAKFGMFIHWGLYSIPAGKWADKTNDGEWIMLKQRKP